MYSIVRSIQKYIKKENNYHFGLTFTSPMIKIILLIQPHNNHGCKMRLLILLFKRVHYYSKKEKEKGESLMEVRKFTRKSAIARLMVVFLTILSLVVITPNIADAASKPALTKTTRNILVGKKYDLNIKNKIAKSTYEWSSSNKKVATVDKKGVVKGVKQGVATITCKIKTPKKNTYSLKCTVTIINPAKKFSIKNKVTVLNLDQEYDLNRTLVPSTSKDKTTWTTSDASIAVPDKNGKFTALKLGTVTITGKTLSGATDSVTIKVVDKEGVVTNQQELDELLGSGAAKITIKTTDTISFNIEKGNYTNQTLVVDAPNSDVTNRGKFAVIEIKQIKSNTWYEHAVGNLLKILAKDASVVVSSTAEVSIEVNADGATLRIVDNGVVKEVTVKKPANITFEGSSKTSVPVVIDVPGIKITSSVPLNLECKAVAELTLLKGAEGTTVHAASKSLLPNYKGNITIKATIGDDTTAIDFTGTPIDESTYIPGGGGGVTPDPTGKTYTLPRSLSEITEIYVTYAGDTYVVKKDLINQLISFLNAEADKLKVWKGTVKTVRKFDGQTVTVEGTEGSNTKKVTFTDGELKGRSYEVTVSDAGVVTVKNNASGKSFTVTKGTDNKSLTFSQVPAGLTFTVKSGDTFILEKSYTELTAIKVEYAGKTYSIDATILATLKKFLAAEDKYLKMWKDTLEDTRKYGDQTVKITSTDTVNKKTVAFIGGSLDGKTYTVTVNDNGVVDVKGTASFTITKGNDGKSLTISNAPSGLVFTPIF